MIDWSTCAAVERDPSRVSGAWLFRGTRVPVAALFENLEDGAWVIDFVQWFPGVAAEQARAVLEYPCEERLPSQWCELGTNHGTDRSADAGGRGRLCCPES